MHIPLDGIIIPTHILDMINLLTLTCKICRKEFGLSEFDSLKEHELNCAPPNIPLMLTDVFKMNETSDIPRLAEEACLHVLKTKMKQESSKSQSCKLVSGGPRPTVVSITPVAYKPSTEVSKKTLRKRTLDLKTNIEMVAGSSSDSNASTLLQVGMLLKGFDSEERQKILEVGQIEKSRITADNLVAMKADLSMPWEKMKAMARWLNKFNISTDSNAKQRVVAKKWHCDAFVVEDAPFTFPVKDRRNQFKILSAPYAYILNFAQHVLLLLDLLDEHGQLIFENPEDPVLVKIGGDHGGNSFKMTYQIVNVDKPNSKENTMVFCMFEAKDYRTNLEVALSMYKKEIFDLQQLKWKSRRIEVLIFGDYEFQCVTYGISGASGRHCCLYCGATKADMQINKHAEPRSLESLKQSYEDYKRDGSI